MAAATKTSWSIPGFLGRYVFSRDHKVIGTQFLFSTMIWAVVGGLLALAIRWQLAWPWSDMPIFGGLYASEGGQIAPEFYTMLFTMHASIMIFFVIIPVLAGAFGNWLIPLMIGADDMAFPTLNMLSYWVMWPAFILMGASLCTVGFGPHDGWTAYPPLSVLDASPAQTLWLLGLAFVGVSSMMGSINYMTTIIQMRAPGMTMFRMPMTIWGMFITAILQAFALPVLTAGVLMQLSDRAFGTGFFTSEGLLTADRTMTAGGGQALLWQHLFWFYSHPAVYIMILPAMGMVSDMISCFARKPLFGYRPMVYSVCGIAGLGFIVWGHHMFVSGMDPIIGLSFMVSTMLIALPSGVKTFNWLATLWNGRIQYTAAMLFSIGFLSMFIIGGLSGIFMAATPVDIYIHDTYFIVAHFHYVLFGGAMMAIFGAVYFWFPKMFGRLMDERLGKLHFFLTFVFTNGTFYPMHVLGAAGFPRRYADPYHFESFRDLLLVNQIMTVSAIALGIVQLIFVANFAWSLCFGKRASRNPWQANTLEWTTPSPPAHGNFDFQPIVTCGPYEYSCPTQAQDFRPQCEAPV